MSSNGFPVNTAGSGDLKAIESCLNSFGISGAGKNQLKKKLMMKLLVKSV